MWHFPCCSGLLYLLKILWRCVCACVCLCVWECTQAKAIWGDYKTHPQPELLVCFHGEFESALKNWLHPVIKDGGHICLTWQTMMLMMGPLFFPCASFSWQWLNEFVGKKGGGGDWSDRRKRALKSYFSHHVFVILVSPLTYSRSHGNVYYSSTFTAIHKVDGVSEFKVSLELVLLDLAHQWKKSGFWVGSGNYQRKF